MNLVKNALLCALILCFMSVKTAHSDTPTPAQLTAQITALQTQVMAQADAQSRIYYVYSEHRADVLERAQKFGKADTATMRAASALYRQIAADYAAQSIPKMSMEAEAQANFCDSLVVLYHPEDKAAKTQLVDQMNAMLLKNYAKSSYGFFDSDNKTALEWKNSGNLSAQFGNLLGALKSYQKAITVDPKLADAHNNIGSVYEQIGYYPGALEAFRAATALDPQHRLAHHNLATTYHRAGFEKEALAAANEALRFAPSPDVKIEVLKLRGSIRLAQNDRAGAIEEWRAQIAADPQHNGRGIAWANIGMAALADADIATAQTAFKNSVDFAPLSDTFQTLYAMSLNALELKILAEIKGVTPDALPLEKQTEIGTMAREQLKNVQPIGGSYYVDSTILDYWADTIPNSPLAKGANLSLLRRCQSVLDTLMPRM